MKQIAAFALALALAGCAALTTPPPSPNVEVPAGWNEAAASSPAPIAPDWWQAFGSAELSGLIADALKGSPDLAIAIERVKQAEAQVRVAGASLFPVLDLEFGSSTRRTSGGGAARSSEASNATLSASYELDLWGRNAAGVSAARSALHASAYDRDAARLTLLAGVATGYFQVLSLRARLAIARENLAIAERVYALVSARARNGAVSQLDVARQEATVLAQRAALLPLEQQERQTLAALAVLTGRVPEGFVLQQADLAALPVPAVTPALPAEALVRRPDLASAEAQLLSANANLAAARAALLPSIQLTTSAGISSAALLAVLHAPASAISLAASVLQPVFEGGRLRGQVALSQARELELAQGYRKAILAALADVENALVAADRSARQEELQRQAEERSRAALRLAEVRYREGADDLLNVLDAQRTLFQAQDQLAQIRLARLNAAVSLYKSLGGGWSERS